MSSLTHTRCWRPILNRWSITHTLASSSLQVSSGNIMSKLCLEKLTDPSTFFKETCRRCPTEVRKQAYISLIRPTLEYTSTCWDPYNKTQITALESVLRKAARFIANDHRKTTSVTALLEKFELPTLQQRRSFKTFHDLQNPSQRGCCQHS